MTWVRETFAANKRTTSELPLDERIDAWNAHMREVNLNPERYDVTDEEWEAYNDLVQAEVEGLSGLRRGW